MRSTAALSALPDYFRAGLSPHDAADRLVDPGPASEPFPRPPQSENDDPTHATT